MAFEADCGASTVLEALHVARTAGSPVPGGCSNPALRGESALTGGAWHPDSPRIGVPGILSGSAMGNGSPRSQERLAGAWQLIRPATANPAWWRPAPPCRPLGVLDEPGHVRPD